MVLYSRVDRVYISCGWYLVKSETWVIQLLVRADLFQPRLIEPVKSLVYKIAFEVYLSRSRMVP